MDTFKDGAYHKDSFSGGSNIYLNLITCDDMIVILLMIQNTYYIGTIHTSFIQEWIERSQRLANICNGPA